MKRLLTFLSAIAAFIQMASAYDFSAVAPSGQTLYYNLGEEGVIVTYPIHNGENRYTSLTGHLTIPDSVTRSGNTYAVVGIGHDAFNHCFNLTSVTIPYTVTRIDNNAFYYCPRLTQTYYTGTIAQWVNIIFSNTFSNPMYYSQEFFINDTSVTNLLIPDSVSKVGDYTFLKWNFLTSITIPNSVTSIGDSAFKGCDHLTNIILGSGLQSIGGGAFEGCTQMVRIKSYATTAPTIVSTTFKGLSDDVILNVPCGYGSVYENAAYWHRFDIQEDLMYDFSVRPQDPSRGTVQILNAPSCDNYEAQIQANAYHNYHFARWSDGNTDNPRYIVVMQDVNLEAIFLAEGETEGIDDVEEGALRVWANNGHIYVATDNAAGMEASVEVYDMKGCKVATMNTGEESPLLAMGVYLVKVGDAPARRVVVLR